MNINRNNYEEYFLMYVDNELTSEERSAVEAFIALNPDLKAELEILQQTILQPEPLSFDKSSLFAIATKGINRENHEEYFVEYVNNELTADEKNATETFVLQHPELQDSFTAFKATVLPKEIIEFKNKEVLYRKEDVRVIAFSFQRFAVAAAVLGIVATGIWFYPSDNSTEQPLAKTTVKKQSVTNNNAETASAEKTTEVASAEMKSSSVTKEEIAVQSIVENPANNTLAIASVTKQNDVRSTNTTDETTRRIAGTAEMVTTAGRDLSTGAIETNKTPSIDITDPLPAAITTVTAVAYTELETDETDNNVYVGALSINKEKLKGVFRKAGRLFASKAKTDNEEGKVQIANLEIETRKLK